MEQITKAAQKAANLTRQLLAFGRKQILQPEILDLNKIVSGLKKMLGRLIRENIELNMDLAPDLGPIEADPGQLAQVIINLAVNAGDAMPDGGKLIIETKNVELDEDYARRHVEGKPGLYVMMAVTDTGIGMTKDVQERIFEPFFTTKEEGKGTGLGLSTVYGIVKQSRGNIYVYSESGMGTTFKIYFPRTRTAAVDRKRATEAIRFSKGTETILTVEDDEILRNVVVKTLSRGGYRVLTAANGEEALRFCRDYREPIHLLLTDMVMPGIGGKELAGKAKELRTDLKVLFMSGYADRGVVENGVLEKGTPFIQKPFTGLNLAVQVRKALEDES
ncbi:MAG TPA: response regulator [Desulfobacteraceae bacterium]|nr:response regulator [Desulfobacteraceae bacterium]